MTRAGVASMVAAVVLIVGRAAPRAADPPVDDEQQIDFDRADTERVPQLVSDHPDNARRSEALRAHFRQNPATFGAFSSDIARARPLTVPKDAPAVFVR
jgi:hypothetical protein